MSSTKLTITIAAAILAAAIIIKKLMWPFIQKYFFYEKLNAGAVLLNVQPTGIHINKQKQVILQLQVEPDQGKNFVTEMKAMFNEAEVAVLQPGTRVFVTYNAHNHKKISLQKGGLNTPDFSVQHSNN
jgi:hypothetical protein